MKKALVADQSGPKQKHVRAIILYTWDMQGAGSFWTAITTYPLLGDDTVAFKAMITIHKVISQGHSACLKDAVSQKTWIKKLANGAGYSGYSKLIAGYAEYLCNKIDFHRDYPAFSGTFDYEEYVSLRGIDNPDEGYETISSLLALLVKLDALQKLIFQDFRGASSSEARVASLVPLVEESYGIYQFLVSMLTAMHQIIGSAEVMGPLRDQFNQSHYALLQFYSECSAINYLTSLVTVPVLSREPPNFLAQGQPTRQPKANPNKQNEEAEKAKMRLEREEMERESMMQQQMQMRQQQEMEARQRMEMEQRQFQQQELERQQRDDMLRRQEFERMQRQEQERFRLQQQQQEQQMSQSRLLDAQSQMDYLQKQSLQDRSTIEQYHRRMAELEAQMSKMAVENAGAAQKQGTISTLQEEINQWKQKYEALAKLYAQLRKEHLDLLNKFKSFREVGSKMTDEARRDAENVKLELAKKNAEYTDLLIERNRLKGEADRIRQSYEGDLARVKQELESSNAAMRDISSTRGQEVQSLVARFTADQHQLEALIEVCKVSSSKKIASAMTCNQI